MGQEMARMLSRRRTGEAAPPPVVLETELVVRSSG
jgi:DNA-binding LacI/PurR family transcriptional regulator